jgi:Ca2+-transporting ATPase
MIDPPRPEVKDSIQKCHDAGIRVIMITWDNIITASAIWAELWLKWKSMEWIALDDMTDAQVKKLLNKVCIFARVSPNHKQRLVKLLKSEWNVVAMTWDWVNDAPALKHADIWVAMWITGTDVSKEASDLILLDDNFSTIVNAIREWRWIYDNIRKFVNFMFSTNFSEILIIFIASICWMPAPLLAIQILWLNLVTDSLPALALWIDPKAQDIMEHKPRKKWTKILDKQMLLSILMIAIFVTIWCLSFFMLNRGVLDLNWEPNLARTWVMLLLVILEMLAVFIVRADYWVKFLSNKWLFAAVLGSIWLTLLVVYIPFFANIFDSVALRWTDLFEMLIITWIWIIWAIVWHKLKKIKFIKGKLWK